MTLVEIPSRSPHLIHTLLAFDVAGLGTDVVALPTDYRRGDRYAVRVEDRHVELAESIADRFLRETP